jgi:hypothetical protein
MSGKFSGIPFVAGDVRGVRSWSVDPLGRLISPSYRTVWTPGENVAACKRDEGTGLWGNMTLRFTTSAFLGEPVAIEKDDPDSTTTKVKPIHVQEKCSCGFYAYSNGVNEYTEYGLTGVIQGYGQTQLGTRGFKSQKARVLALHIPTRREKKSGKRVVSSKWDHYDRLRQNYPDVVMFEKYADMLAAFPVYENVPTPDTDPEFWTRSI